MNMEKKRRNKKKIFATTNLADTIYILKSFIWEVDKSNTMSDYNNNHNKIRP